MKERAVPVTFDRSAEPGVVRLEGEIDIALAAALKEVLLEALASAGEVRISLETATGFDVTAVQLLWAAEREAKASGVVLALQGPVPEKLRATLEEAGLERFPFADSPAAASEAQ
jgi:anti-anti-sigma factor